MYQKQRGATMWQWLFYGLVGIVVVYLGLNLTPIYIEGMAVKKAIKQLENAGTMTKREVIKKVDAQFYIDQVDSVDAKELEFKPLRNGKTEVSLEYEKRVHLIGNLFVLVEFKNRVEI
ncbi:MAG: DUF4845 domain-containing protein [Gammaproteobacteria bacterium]|nr:DUF4845 domain-containing protein [Alteromonadaceae bacterium]NVK88102.1 DUF4845 domain-containing protein [Gammaproteobacteria bacterium]